MSVMLAIACYASIAVVLAWALADIGGPRTGHKIFKLMGITIFWLPILIYLIWLDAKKKFLQIFKLDF